VCVLRRKLELSRSKHETPALCRNTFRVALRAPFQSERFSAECVRNGQKGSALRLRRTRAAQTTAQPPRAFPPVLRQSSLSRGSEPRASLSYRAICGSGLRLPKNLSARQAEEFGEQTKSGQSRCLVCGWPFLAVPTGGIAVSCSLCTAGDTSLTVRFLEAKRGQKRQIALTSYVQTNRHTIVVAVIQHHGLIHFEFDLWRSGWKLRPEVCERLRQMWESQDKQHLISSAASGGRRITEIHGTFGVTFSRFDTRPERTDYWKALLNVLLSSNSALVCVSLPNESIAQVNSAGPSRF
jgi:hypothetical protein